MTPRLRHVIPALALAAAVVAALFVVRPDRFLSFDRLVASRAALREAVLDGPVQALALYVAAHTAVAAFSIPGGFVLTLTAGFLFGGVLGGVAAAVSAAVGATILFLAARTVLNDSLAQKAGATVDRIRRGFQQEAWSYLLSLRLSPVIPFWLVNISAALAGVPLTTFVWTTAAGVLPVTFVVAFAGENLDRIAAASAVAVASCRQAGGADCRAGLPLSDVVSPLSAGLLLASSALALTPALVRVWRVRQTGRACHDVSPDP